MANWLWLIAHYQTRKGNQGGNQGDDSTGQHYSVTGRTLHMLIRPGEERGRDGQMEGGGKDGERVLKKYRNRFEKRIDCSDYKKKNPKHAMPREGCRHSRKIIKTGKFTRLSDSDWWNLPDKAAASVWLNRWNIDSCSALVLKASKTLFTASLILIEKLFLEMPKELQYTQICFLDFPERGYEHAAPSPPPQPPSSPSSPTDTALLRGAPQTGQTEFDFN